MLRRPAEAPARFARACELDPWDPAPLAGAAATLEALDRSDAAACFRLRFKAQTRALAA